MSAEIEPNTGALYLPPTLEVVNYFVVPKRLSAVPVYEEIGHEIGFNVDTEDLLRTVSTVDDLFDYMSDALADDSRDVLKPEVVRFFRPEAENPHAHELGTFVMRTGAVTHVENLGHLEGEPRYLSRGWLVNPAFLEREVHPQVTVVTPGGTRAFADKPDVPVVPIGARGILLDKTPIYFALHSRGCTPRGQSPNDVHLFYTSERHHTLDLREILSRAALNGITESPQDERL